MSIFFLIGGSGGGLGEGGGAKNELKFNFLLNHHK